MTADIVRKGVQERLDRLGVDKVDLLQFHWWTFEHPAWLDALHEMARLKEEGLIGAIGVTNFDAAHLRVALADGIPLATNQVSFSLVDRRAAGELSALCREKGVKLLAYGTLCGGFLSEKWLGKPEPDEHARLEPFEIQALHRCRRRLGRRSRAFCAAAGEIARKHGVSISNVATRWVLEHEAVAAAIIGARLGESEHRDDNLKVFGFALDAEDHARARRCLRRDETHPRRLRRRIPQAALSHRVGRPQPSPRRDPVGLQGRAGAGHARPACASRRAASGSRSPATAAPCASRTRSASRAPPPRMAATAASRPAIPARRRPTSSTRSRRRSPRSAAAWRTWCAPASICATPRKWEPVSRAHGRVFGAHPAGQHAGRRPAT